MAELAKVKGDLDGALSLYERVIDSLDEPTTANWDDDADMKVSWFGRINFSSLAFTIKEASGEVPAVSIKYDMIINSVTCRLGQTLTNIYKMDH